MKQECSQGTQGNWKSIFKHNFSFGQNQSIGGTFSVDFFIYFCIEIVLEWQNFDF